MKAGKTLVELATEIQRQAEVKKDFIVPTQSARIVANAGAVTLAFGDQHLSIGAVAHDQIGSHAGIPAKYYDRMLAEAPELLATNVNEWFDRYPARRMVRTLDNKARGFLSDSYRPMDNFELAEAALPILQDIGVEIVSAEITERRFYIKAVDKKVLRELPAGAHMGDGGHTIVRTRQLSPSITITNSEIGFGSLSVLGGTFDAFCTNLAIFGERSMKKYHVGSKHGDIAEGDVYSMLSDTTRRLDDAALWSKVGDVIRGAFDVARFDALVGKLKDSQEQKLGGDIPAIVELTANRFGMKDGERKSVLDHLIKGGDLSRFGLHNAVTRTAEDLEDYDRATEFERIGGQIIELGANDWRQLAEAA